MLDHISNRIPDDWRKAIIIPVFKKGYKTDCNTYREITSLNSAYKIYTKIFTRCLNAVTEVLPQEEHEF
jgi:predicted secreted protein